MPYEFKDLSKEVSKGAKQVGGELQKMIVNTVKVDKAQKKLTKTQKSALQITEKYRKSLRLMNREFVNVKKASLAASKGLLSLSKGRVMYHMTGLAATVEDLKDSLQELSKIKATVSLAISGSEDITKTVKAAKELAKIGLRKAPKHLADYAKETKKASAASDRMGKSSRYMRDDIEKMQGIQDLLMSQFREGRRDAGYFAEGLGLTGTKAIAAGVAAFFLLQKAGDLIDKFKDARMEVGKFNVDLARLGKVTLGVDASQLEGYRKELYLTRQQASQFFDVLRDGVSSGVISVQQMIDAAHQLQEAFGGDPTERLRTYVGLLKEIPTLDADLKVTASLDDQAASLFDLARKGKISTVIELQQAGLLGAIDVSVTSPEDVALLNANQRTEKHTEAIKDYLLTKLFPSFGPQLSAISEYTFKTFGAVGIGFATVGALNYMLGRKQDKQIRATERVEHAVWATAGKEIPGGRDIPRTLLRGVKDAFSRGYIRGGGGRAGIARGAKGAVKATMYSPVVKNALDAAKKIKGMSTAINIATKGFSRIVFALKGIAGPAAIIGLALGAAGKAADWLSEKLESSGNKTGAALAKMQGVVWKASGTILTFAATGAVLGSIFPVVGTAAGAAAGALIGLGKAIWDNTEVFGEAVQSFGKELGGTITVAGKPIQKYIGIVGKFGDELDYAGGFLVEFGKAVKAETRKKTKPVIDIKSYGPFIDAFRLALKIASAELKFFQRRLSSPAYREALDDNAKLMDEASKAAESMAVSSKKFDDLWNAALDKTMQSALALEKELNATAAVAKTGKVALADFQKEVAGLDLDMLSRAGGTAGQFNDAVKSSSDAIRNKFGELTSEFAKRRKEIAANAKMDADSRKAALLYLHQKEIEATREFVDAMSGLIESLMKTPKAIAAGLKGEIAATRLEITSGVLSTKEIGAELEKGVSSLIDGFREALAAGPKVEAEIRKREEAKATAEKKMKEVAPEQLKGKRGRVKDVFKDVFDIVKEGDKEVVKGVKDAKLAAERLEQLKNETSKIRAEFEKLRDEAEMGEAIVLSKSVMRLTQNLEKAQKGLGLAQKAAEEAAGKAEGSEAANKEVLEKSKVVTNLTAERDKTEQKLADTYKRLGLTTKESQDALKAALASGDQTAIAKYARAGDASAKEATEAFIAQGAQMEKSIEAMEKRARYTDEMNKKQEDISVLENALTAVTDLTNQNMTNRLGVLKNQQKIQQDFVDFLAKAVDIDDVATWETKKRLESLKASAETDALAGRSLENLTKTSKEELNLYHNRLELTKEIIAKIDAGIEANRAFLAEPGISAADIQKTKKLIGVAEMTRVEVTKKADEAAKGLATAISRIGDASADASSDMQAVESQFRIDLSASQFEMAEFSSNAGAMIVSAVAVAKKGLRDRLEIERRYADEAAKLQLEAIPAQVAVEDRRLAAQVKVGKITEKEHALKLQDFKTERERAAEVKKQLVYTQIETKFKKDMAKLASDAFSIKFKELEISNEILDARLRYAMESGASYSSILNMQKQQVDAARKEWEYRKRVLELAEADSKIAGDSTKMAELRKDVELAEIRMREKSLGVQRDIFEKMIGAALGGIRTEVGARRQRLTDVGLMGMERTRVKAPSGMYQKAGPGGVKPYQDRLNELRLGVKDIRDQGAERIQLEKDMAQNLRGTKTATETTARATDSLNIKGTTKGSLYTYDSVSEGLLSSILAQTVDISQGVWAVTGGTGGAVAGVSPLSPDDVASIAAKGRETAPTGGAPAPMGAPEAAVVGVGGASASKIEGRITVHFDNMAFRDEVADVVGRIIQTPEIQKSLQKSGTINKNQ